MAFEGTIVNLLGLLNPLSPVGGLLGRIIAPTIVTASVLLAAPFSPLELMDIVPGFDFSYSRAAEPWYKEQQQAGAQIFVQGVWTGIETPGNACENLRSAKAASVPRAIYTSLSDAHYGYVNVDRAHDVAVNCGGWDDLEFVAIDIELPITNPTEQIQQAIDRVLYYGGRPAIYTSYNAWRSYANNTCRFNTIPLWNAFWDNSPDIDFLSLPFGCWTAENLLGEQYTGGHIVSGVNVDASVFGPLAFRPRLSEGFLLAADLDGDGKEGWVLITPAGVSTCNPKTLACTAPFVPWSGYGTQQGVWIVTDQQLTHLLGAYAHPWRLTPDGWEVGYIGAP